MKISLEKLKLYKNLPGKIDIFRKFASKKIKISLAMPPPWQAGRRHFWQGKCPASALPWRRHWPECTWQLFTVEQ